MDDVQNTEVFKRKISDLGDLDYHTSRGVILSQKQISSSPRYAYAFLMAGCDPQKPAYLGFLFNILISAQALKDRGSKADIIAFVRMAARSNATTLPQRQVAWLNTMGVQIRYLPKPEEESFFEATILKFRILELVEYRRVIFLDGDATPLCNLDYIFELSDGENAVIKENLIIAGQLSPANGGFFMLEPGLGRWEEILQIIKNQQANSRHLPYPHFNETQGWGHVIEAYDRWEGFKNWKVGRKWDFYGAYIDQGLLYHYVKYVRQSVAIVTGEATNVVQNWHEGLGSRVQLEAKVVAPFQNYSCMAARIMRGEKCGAHLLFNHSLTNLQPHSDFVHFMGPNKPWKHDLSQEPASHRQYWFCMLRTLNGKLNMGIDFTNWKKYSFVFRGKSPLHDAVASIAAYQNNTSLSRPKFFTPVPTQEQAS